MTPDPRLTRTLTDALAAEDIHLARADIANRIRRTR